MEQELIEAVNKLTEAVERLTKATDRLYARQNDILNNDTSHDDIQSLKSSLNDLTDTINKKL